MDRPIMTGVLFAVIIAMTKVIEWLVKKYGPKNGSSHASAFGYDQARQLREVHERSLRQMEDIKDLKKHSEKMAEALADTAKCLERVARSQAKTAETLDEIDKRQAIEEEVRKRLQAVGGE